MAIKGISIYDDKKAVHLNQLAQDADTSVNGPAIPTDALTIIEVHAVWTGVATFPAGVITLETSPNGVDFQAIPGATFTITTAAGNEPIISLSHAGRFFRHVYTLTNATAGTIDFYDTAKRNT